MLHSALQQPAVPGAYISYLARAFDDHAGLVAGTPLDPARLGALVEPVSVSQLLRIVGNANALATAPDWYLPWAKGMAEHFHGPVTIALLTAPTLGAGLDAFVRHMPQRVPYLLWRGTRVRGRYHCELVELIDLGTARQVLIESPILCMHEYVRTIRGGRVSGAHVELRYPRTSHAEHYAGYFECPVRFDAPHNAMVFPEDWLDTPNAGFDAAGFRMALRQCAQAASAREENPLLAARRCVQTWIDERIEGGAPPSLQALAVRLHVSPRTLVRRLGNAGTTYQAMLDEIQFERARGLLARRDWRLAGIARELGFHDAASFTRSFKRWSGMTPGHYRASLLAAA